MKKYRQTVIPEASTKAWSGLSKYATQKKVFDYYKANYLLNGKHVINQDLGISVAFERKGAEKTSFGGFIYSKKACLVEILDKVIRYAEYSNWGDRKPQDIPTVLGYLNFKVKVRIDGIMEHVHLVIRVNNSGKFHYSMDINK
ncbi:MAG: hypothetical protein LBI89_03940 [Prevotellaceae bacterium]|jgi:hypothetical protein|nr:hypothetical protein [Prevotellaceae bacterium]